MVCALRAELDAITGEVQLGRALLETVTFEALSFLKLFFSKATLRPGRHRNCNPLLMANELLKAEVSSASRWRDRWGHHGCQSSWSVVPQPFHFAMLRLGSWLCRLAAVPTGAPPPHPVLPLPRF